MVFDTDGRMVASLPQFEEALSVFDIEVRPVYRQRLLDPRGHSSAPPLPVQGHGCLVSTGAGRGRPQLR